MNKPRIFKNAAVAAAIFAAVITMTAAGGSLAPKNALAAGETEAPATTQAPAVTSGSITVTGQGSVKVKPDIAYVSVGVTTSNEDVKTAQSDNANTITAVIDALKNMGIAEADISTSGYSVYPNYSYDSNKGTSAISGYQVNNYVNVTVRNIDSVGAVIDAAAGSGANNINSIQFSISDSTNYYAQALALAVKNAKTKAVALASAINVKLSAAPVSITENYGNNMPTTYYDAGTANIMAASAESAAPTPISAGQLEITANISVVYNY